jgi:hypothetical protein
MSSIFHSASEKAQPLIYQIRVEGHLSRNFTDWFEGLIIQLTDNGETLLTGPVVDQAALHGVLRKVRDVGLPLHAAQLRETRRGQCRKGFCVSNDKLYRG